MANPTNPLQPVAPTPPDFFLCSSDYGRFMTREDCFAALNMLPGGSRMISWQVTPPGQPFLGQYNPTGLPLIVESGDCRINVEVAGPNLPASLMMAPNNLRSMASYVIEKCVVRQGGYGGFITAGFHRLVNYIIERNLLPVLAYTELRKSYLICISNDLTPPLIALSDGGTASSTAFITITVTHAESPKSGKQPGNTDPAIPLVIGKYMHAAVGGSEGSGQLPKIRSIGGQMWELASTGMIRSSSTTWWLSASQSSTHDEMTYECDTALGSPAVVDCTQVEWNQLGPPSDTVRVGPGMVQFLHSNTCFVAISAEIIILLSWSQIRTAVSTIMNMCIQNPLQSSQGGRAYYKSAAKATRRDGGFTQLTGLNALPPHTNITIFQQQEPWTDPTKELSSCTWDAVQNRNPLTKCLTA